MDSESICDICYESYEESGDKTPRTLSECTHTFCESCLTKLITDNTIVCPVCKRSTTLAKGIKGVNPNYALIDLIKTVKEGKAGPAKTTPAKTAAEKLTKTVAPEEKLPSLLKELESVEVSVTARANEGKEHHDVLISIQPPEGLVASPCDICCVIDVSGSMGTEATMQNSAGEVESHGLSLLDVVKHSVKTIIQALKDNDRLSLVAFASVGKVVLELTQMNERGKTAADAALAALRPTDSTNLWDGLLKGMDTLRLKGKAPVTSVFLFTDGEPNVNPPMGHLPMLAKYQRTYPDWNCAINLFGFGYSLDSILLNQLATQGHGIFSFIPDSGMVGTVFVNAVSNLKATMTTDLTLKVEPMNEGKILSVMELPTGETSFHLGSLQFGQHRDVVLSMKLPLDKKPYLLVKVGLGSRGKVTEKVVEGVRCDGKLEVDTERQRFVFISSLSTAFAEKDFKKAQQIVEKACKQISSPPYLKDMEGQVTLAYSRKDWYTKWGRHYLLSLARANSLQQCTNFKDVSLQIYGGKLFQALREDANDIFCSLPPPTASLPAKVVVTTMSSYNNVYNGCFAGSSLVAMGDGSLKRMDQVHKGDLVRTVGSVEKSVRVICVLETKCSEPVWLTFLPNDLMITPYHPIQVEDQWRFPCDISKRTEQLSVPAVYNIVLEADHILVVNGFKCVTLGHGLKGSVIEHPYFGTDKVIQDLQAMPGWTSGHITLESGWVRDPSTNLICGFTS